MTVYTGDLKVMLAEITRALDEAPIGTATPIQVAAIIAASQRLAEATAARLATLDATLPSEGSGGLSLLVSGADPEASAALLKATLADFEQAAELHSVLGYARRLVINLREARRLQ